MDYNWILRIIRSGGERQPQKRSSGWNASSPIMVCLQLKVWLKCLFTHTHIHTHMSNFLASVTTLTHTNQLVFGGEGSRGDVGVCLHRWAAGTHTHARAAWIETWWKKQWRGFRYQFGRPSDLTPFVWKSPLYARDY